MIVVAGVAYVLPCEQQVSRLILLDFNVCATIYNPCKYLRKLDPLTSNYQITWETLLQSIKYRGLADIL